MLAVNNESCTVGRRRHRHRRLRPLRRHRPAHPTRLRIHCGEGDSRRRRSTGERATPPRTRRRSRQRPHGFIVAGRPEAYVRVRRQHRVPRRRHLRDHQPERRRSRRASSTSSRSRPTQGVDIVDDTANGDPIFHHDVVVKKIGGVQTMLASYWDAGYVKLDVNDPADPRTSATRLRRDPADRPRRRRRATATRASSPTTTGTCSPPTRTSAYRAGAFAITTGPNAGEYPSQVGGGDAVAVLPDLTLNGPTVYGGYGCDASRPIPRRASVIPTARSRRVRRRSSSSSAGRWTTDRTTDGGPASRARRRPTRSRRAGTRGARQPPSRADAATADEALLRLGRFPPDARDDVHDARGVPPIFDDHAELRVP